MNRGMMVERRRSPARARGWRRSTHKPASTSYTPYTTAQDVSGMQLERATVSTGSLAPVPRTETHWHAPRTCSAPARGLGRTHSFDLISAVGQVIVFQTGLFMSIYTQWIWDVSYRMTELLTICTTMHRLC